MMNKMIFALGILLALGACSEPTIESPPPVMATEQACQDIDHSAKNALDWTGVYHGNTQKSPQTNVVLLPSERYILTTEQTASDKTQGVFYWEDCNSVIKLDNGMRFFVAEGHLQQLPEGVSHYQENSPYVLRQTEKTAQ